MAAAEAAGGALGDDDEEPISLEALAAQLAALEAEEAEERRRRAKLEAEVAEAQSKLNARARDEARIAQEMERLAMDGEVEELVLQEMRLEKLEAATRALDRRLVAEQSELAAMEELLQSQQQQAEAQLLPHMQGTLLAASLAQAYGSPAEAVKTLGLGLGGGGAANGQATDGGGAGLDESQSLRFRLVDHIMEKRRQERDAQAERHQQRMRQLNENRRKLLADRRALLDQPDQNGGTPHRPPASASSSRPTSVSSLISKIKKELPKREQQLEQLREEHTDFAREHGTEGVEYHGQWGVDSYEHWQLPTYYMVRSIVDSIIDDVIEQHDVDIPDAGVVIIADQVWQNDRTELREQLAAAQLAADAWAMLEEIERAVVEHAVRDIWQEFLDISDLCVDYSSGILVSAVVEIGLEGGRAIGDSRSMEMLVRSIAEMQRRRARHPEVVRHSLILKNVGKVEAIAGPPVALQDVNFDLEAISMAETVPFHRLSDRDKGKGVAEYSELELEYWKRVSAQLVQLDVPAKAQTGIVIAVPDPRNTSIALVTVAGDVLVWKRMAGPASPLSPFKMVLVRKTGLPAISGRPIHVAWSLDCLHLLVVDNNGSVHQWSLLGTGVVTGASGWSDRQGMRHMLTLTSQELAFSAGAFVDAQPPGAVKRTAATTAAFFPSFSLLMQQPQFVVGLANGDILKCLPPNMATIATAPVRFDPHMGQENYIGKQVSAELFRGHTAAVKQICFVENRPTMVSLDDGGVILTWEYSDAGRTGFGWYAPAKKCRFEPTITVYNPSPTGGGKTYFTDIRGRKEGRKHGQTKQEVNAARRVVEAKIAALKLPAQPWHSQIESDGSRTEIYAPSRVRPHGDVFHVIKRTATGQLTMYMTKLYVPERKSAEQILAVTLSSDHRRFHFMLLFPASPPKPPHITLASVDVASMGLGEQRIDVSLTPTEYTLCSQGECGLAYLPVLAGTASEYLVAIIANRLRLFSLTTGQEIRTWLPQRGPFQNTEMGMAAMPRPDGMDVVFFSGRNNRAYTVALTDQNATEAAEDNVRVLRMKEAPAATKRFLQARRRQSPSSVEAWMRALVQEIVVDATAHIK